MMYMVNGTSPTLRAHGSAFADCLGFLHTPAVGNAIAGILALGLDWACDNGCFAGFNEVKYLRMLDRVAGLPRLLWVTAPDVVGDSVQTLVLFHKWQPILAARGLPIAFVGQDGCTELPDLPFDCLFVGGTTEWKLGPEAAALIAKAKAAGKMVHMGRVNSLKRIRLAHNLGCDSVDGTSASMFSRIYIPKFAAFIRVLHEEAQNEQSPSSV